MVCSGQVAFDKAPVSGWIQKQADYQASNTSPMSGPEQGPKYAKSNGQKFTLKKQTAGQQI
jgi:hypothetical protein